MKPIPVYRTLFTTISAGMDEGWRAVVLAAFEDMVSAIENPFSRPKARDADDDLCSCFLRQLNAPEPYAVVVSYDAYRAVAQLMPEEICPHDIEGVLKVAAELIERPQYVLDQEALDQKNDAEAELHHLYEIVGPECPAGGIQPFVRDQIRMAEVQAESLRSIRSALGGHEDRDLVEVIGEFSRELHKLRKQCDPIAGREEFKTMIVTLYGDLVDTDWDGLEKQAKVVVDSRDELRESVRQLMNNLAEIGKVLAKAGVMGSSDEPLSTFKAIAALVEQRDAALRAEASAKADLATAKDLESRQASSIETMEREIREAKAVAGHEHPTLSIVAVVRLLMKSLEEKEALSRIGYEAGSDAVGKWQREIRDGLGLEHDEKKDLLTQIRAKISAAQKTNPETNPQQAEINRQRIDALRDIREALCSDDPRSDRPLVEVVKEVVAERDRLRQSPGAFEEQRDGRRQKALLDVRDALGLPEGFTGYIADHVKAVVAERDALKVSGSPSAEANSPSDGAVGEKPAPKPRPWTAGYTPKQCHEVLTRLADREEQIAIAATTRIPGGTKTVSNILQQYFGQIEHARALVGESRATYLASVLRQMEQRLAFSKKETVNA